jgi:hypothetical protein
MVAGVYLSVRDGLAGDEGAMTFLEAIAREEGFLVKNSRADRNNNPGNLEYHPWMGMYGAKGGDPRFAIFPTAKQGYAAMRALFESNAYKGLTVAQALNKWAPVAENNTNLYVKNVCAWTGCNPTDIVDDLLDK